MEVEFIGKTLLINKGDEKILVIGDMHLGYEEELNKSGVLVTRSIFGDIIRDLGLVFDIIISSKMREKYKRNKKNEKLDNNLDINNEKFAGNILRANKLCRDGKNNGIIDKIVFLGDLKHCFSGIRRQEWNNVLRLFDFLADKCKEIIVIRGNHDNYLKSIINKGENVKVKDYYIWNNFCFVHGNRDFKEIWDKKIKFLVVGHLHPAVKLSDGVKAERYKCFLEGRFMDKNVIIVPSFFDYGGGIDVCGGKNNLIWKINFDKFKVRIIGEDLEVLDFGLLRDLN